MEKSLEQYRVDLDNIHKNRIPGISGIMRVRDDAEFIEASVESCIDALDELVIVYNGCTDNSPQEISRVAERYPDKVKVWHYEPKVYGIGLTQEEYEMAKSLPADSPNLLAGYCNFALSKTTRTHVMKIDADQIYFSDSLIGFLKRIREARFLNLSPLDWVAFAKLARKLRYLQWLPGDSTDDDFMRYRRVLEYLCKKGLFSPALSGLNIVFRNGVWYVPQGLKTGDLNILAQFNGTFDTLVFKVRKGTRFIPVDNADYAIYNSSRFNYIEKLVGVPRGLSWGFMWWHLNAMRKRIIDKQMENMDKYPDSFRDVREFVRLSPEEIDASFNRDFITPLMGVNYRFYWTHSRREVNPESLLGVEKKLK